MHIKQMFTRDIDREINDTMQFIKPEVTTICTGMAASMAAVLLCAPDTTITGFQPAMLALAGFGLIGTIAAVRLISQTPGRLSHRCTQ